MQMEESCCPAAHIAKTLQKTNGSRSDSALPAAFCCPLMETRGWLADGIDAEAADLSKTDQQTNPQAFLCFSPTT